MKGKLNGIAFTAPLIPMLFQITKGRREESKSPLRSYWSEGMKGQTPASGEGSWEAQSLRGAGERGCLEGAVLCMLSQATCPDKQDRSRGDKERRVRTPSRTDTRMRCTLRPCPLSRTGQPQHSGLCQTGEHGLTPSGAGSGQSLRANDDGWRLVLKKGTPIQRVLLGALTLELPKSPPEPLEADTVIILC